MSEEKTSGFADEEIKDKAKKIIIAAYEANGFEKLKEITLNETKTGVIELHFASESEIGNVEIKYSPQPFVEGLLNTLATELNSKPDIHFLAEVAEEFHGGLPMFKKMFTEETIGTMTQILLFHFYYESIGFAPDLVLLGLKGFQYMESLGIPDSFSKLINRKENERNSKIEEIFKMLNKRRKTAFSSFEDQVLRQISAPKFIVWDIYQMWLRYCREARKFHTSIKRNKRISVQRTLKEHFSLLGDDLIHKITLDGIEPAEIAFEAVSRDLNIPSKESRDENSRKAYLAESKILQRQKTTQEKSDAFKQFALFWQNKFAEDERKRKLLQDFHYEKSH